MTVNGFPARIGQGRNHGNIGVRQFHGKPVLLANLFQAPALGPVELRDHRHVDHLDDIVGASGLARRAADAFLRVDV